MIKPDQIPDVVKLRLRNVLNDGETNEAVAIAAALNAWPSGAVCHYTIADMEGWEMVLPLPEAERIAKQEESDDD